MRRVQVERSIDLLGRFPRASARTLDSRRRATGRLSPVDGVVGLEPGSASVGGETRDGFQQHPESSVVFSGIEVPDGCRLIGGFGVAEGAWEKPGDGVEFRIALALPGKERLFPRSPGIIGRLVQNCHPPKSLDVVNQINTGAADELVYRTVSPFLFDGEIVSRSEDIHAIWSTLIERGFTVDASEIVIERVSQTSYGRFADTMEVDTFFQRYVPAKSSIAMLASPYGSVLLMLGPDEAQILGLRIQ